MCGWALTFFNNIPAGVGRQNNVVLTSMRRDDVKLMSVRIILTSWPDGIAFSSGCFGFFFSFSSFSPSWKGCK